jgi:hypothetical protein
VVPGAGNPQALNRYAYVYNSPLKYIDPSGHCGILSELLGFFGFISCPADDALDILADPPCGEECQSGPFINTGCGDASRCESGPYIDTGCNNASPCTSAPYINTGCDGSCDLGILADPIPERGGREKYLSNPDGRRGSPGHQAGASEGRKLLEGMGLDIRTEFEILTPGGVKDKRYMDLVGINKETGQPEVAIQVGVQNKNGTPVKRERDAMYDVLNHGTRQVPVIFIPYKTKGI